MTQAAGTILYDARSSQHRLGGAGRVHERAPAQGYGGASAGGRRPTGAWPASGAKPTTGAILARKILSTLRHLVRADAMLVRAEGRLLARLKAEKAHRELGFSSFAHLGREQFQIAIRTAIERVELDTVCRGSPAVEVALLLGDLGLSQVVALAPLFREEKEKEKEKEKEAEKASRPAEPPEAKMAPLLHALGKLSVRELRRRVRYAVRVCAQAQAQEAAGKVREAPAEADRSSGAHSSSIHLHCRSGDSTDTGSDYVPLWLSALLQAPGPDAPEPDSDPAGSAQTASGAPALCSAIPGLPEDFEVVGFAAPAPVRLLWEESLECARKVLGWDAPRHMCAEVILIEGAPEAIAVAEEARVAEAARARLAGSAGDSSYEDRNDAADRSAGRTYRRLLRSLRPVARGSEGRPSRPPARGSRRQPSSGRSAQRTGLTKEFRRELIRQGRERAKRSVALARAHLRDLDSLLDPGEATGAEDAVVRIRQVHLLSRPGRALTARLVRDLSRGDLLKELGYSTAEQFCARELRMGERTADNFCRQAEVFDDCPELEEAYAASEIGAGAALRLWRLAGTNPLCPHDPNSRLARFIRRAAELSYQQLDRECRFFERIHEFSPELAALCPGPFPDPRIEQTLLENLAQTGWDRARVELTLKEAGIRSNLPGPAVTQPGAPGETQIPAHAQIPAEAQIPAPPAEAIPLEPGMESDPACDLQVMRKLEVLLNLLILASTESAVVEGAPVTEAATPVVDASVPSRDPALRSVPSVPPVPAVPPVPPVPPVPAVPPVPPVLSLPSAPSVPPVAPVPPVASVPIPGSVPLALHRGADVLPGPPKTSACPSLPKGDPMVTPGLRGWSRIRFAAPPEVASHWKAAVWLFRRPEEVPSGPSPGAAVPSAPSPGAGSSPREPLPVWAAVSRFLYNALQVWNQQDPKTTPTQADVHERDEYRCQVPGCDRRACLQGHHVRYGKRKKDNHLYNRLSLCWLHHRLLHAGIISVTGRAPFPLFWKIGRPGSKVRLYFIGQRRVRPDP